MTFKLTEKVDVYSFGVVLFEAMCGRLPLIRDTKTRNIDIQISQWVIINCAIIFELSEHFFLDYKSNFGFECFR